MQQTVRLAQAIDPAELAQRMREKRAAEGRVTMQQAAEEAGVCAATFSRVSRGDYTPDVGNLLPLAQWVDAAQVQLPVTSEAISDTATNKTIIHSPGETTLESIALHLHADENLNPDDMDFMRSVLRELYRHVQKLHHEAATS